jgi:ATP-binding cassette subfamily B protein
MLITLARRYLAPYKRWIVLIVGLQTAATLASLYLPKLNGDIIDNGVVNGDTGYIMRIGALMLFVSLLQVAGSVTAVYFGARTAMAFGRDLRSAVFGRVLGFSSREVNGGHSTLVISTTTIIIVLLILILLTD